MDEAKENGMLDLPREEYEPVVAQTVELGFLGTEVALCVFDIHGDREIKTCYGDICKIVDALRDYSRLLKMVCKTWNLQGFHRAKYEFYVDKLREIADKFQDGIGYDYDAALERCRKKQGKKQRNEDVGGEALAMGLLKAQQAAEAKDRKAAEKESGGTADQTEDSTNPEPRGGRFLRISNRRIARCKRNTSCPWSGKSIKTEMAGNIAACPTSAIPARAVCVWP